MAELATALEIDPNLELRPAKAGSIVRNPAVVKCVSQ